jgi:hypothetical protein
VPEELNLVPGDILQGEDSLPRYQLEHRIDHDHGEALLEQRAHFREVHERLGSVHKQSVRTFQRACSNIAVARGRKRACGGVGLESDTRRRTRSPASSAILSGSLSRWNSNT